MDNPTLYPGSLSDDEQETFPWHGDADKPHSSQVFCVSAFGTLRHLSAKDHVLSTLFASKGLLPQAKREWSIQLEYRRPELLSELGGSPTQIDVFCSAHDSIICIESKFLSDASSGFGSCSQPPDKCYGYFGPGSDKKNSSRSTAWCRLESWDGDRAPRSYSTWGRKYFKKEVYAPQSVGDECRFKGPNFQLMRNFLFAAAYAERMKLPNFGVLAICPKGTSATVEQQVRSFQNDVVEPAFNHRAQLAFYEDYLELLRGADSAAKDLAAFLQERITSLT